MRAAEEVTTMMEHTIKAFDADLQDLGRMIAEMGGLAERQIGDALDALSRHDSTQAAMTNGTTFVSATEDTLKGVQTNSGNWTTLPSTAAAGSTIYMTATGTVPTSSSNAKGTQYRCFVFFQ